MANGANFEFAKRTSSVVVRKFWNLFREAESEGFDALRFYHLCLLRSPTIGDRRRRSLRLKVVLRVGAFLCAFSRLVAFRTRAKTQSAL
jgi:hypothetical protein